MKQYHPAGSSKVHGKIGVKAMQLERSRYRGYQIEARREWSNWCVSVHPTRSDLPILTRSTLRTLSPSKAGALAEAKDSIDEALAQLKARLVGPN
jgi:hypothetical protein